MNVQRARSWVGSTRLASDCFYVQNLKFKYLIMCRFNNGIYGIFVQFKEARPAPATRATVWTKKTTCRNAIGFINKGKLFYKKGQLDVWSADPNELYWQRTLRGSHYWRWS